MGPIETFYTYLYKNRYFFIVLSVADLPFDHVHRWEYDEFNGARAVTSPSGKGVIVQHYKQLYELTCEISGCSWRILPQRLSPGVKFAVMMTLPPDYTC